ncbi:hypothetical protein AUP74_00208 [Microbulbifer aggregans]|uniref:Uncharacterized protein n=1 Tax=Microbulbifer aggregans TaxID=1769779 RepID=A0A1C9W3F8_9GAMM|nr:hypothetical protein AUP74_00208 [Microbulbifer aggregans]
MAGAARRPHQIQMVLHQPDDVFTKHALQHLGADVLMTMAFNCFANIVHQCGAPQNGLWGAGSGDFKCLERVEKGIALRVVLGILLHAIQVVEQGKKVVVQFGTSQCWLSAVEICIEPSE